MFSPDGSLLVSVSYDDTVRLWQVNIGQEVQKLEGHDTRLTFSLDNTTLIIDQGELVTNIRTVSTSLLSRASQSSHMLRHDWIEHQGRKLLWLPQEYRTKSSAIFGKAIGIGRTDGHVDILRLCCP